MALWTNHWAGRLRFGEEQFFRERREERYDYLRVYFGHFAGISVEGYDWESGTGTLKHNLRNLDAIRNSPTYSEAKKHLIQDIPSFLEDLTALENSVYTFNDQLIEYTNTLKTMVKNFLSAELSQLEPFVGEGEAPLNSISVDRLFLRLRQFWFGESNFQITYLKDRKSFVIGSANIATAESIHDEKLREIINVLKSWRENTGIALFRKRASEMQTESKRLVKQIHDKVLFPIQRKSYTTVCDECPI